MIHLSTFSIVACDIKSQTWGVAVASKFPAAGAVVPWARANSGAIATQSLANTSFGPQGLSLMTGGLSAEETLARLLADDEERATRQIGIVDSRGASATFTGKSCLEWAGGLNAPGYAIQGNILAGAEVVRQMEHAFVETKGELPERLFASLLAGDQAGGDRRGRQSAALYVVKPKGGYGGFNDRWMDYRVDDHINPVPRLGELLELHRLYFGKSPSSERISLNDGKAVKDIQKIMKKLGYYTLNNGKYDDSTREAFRRFIDNENFEERANPDEGWIDGPVFDYLLKKFK
ncbi:MAG: DUF1028 domain-containing protein [Chloroflexi bacterium]|nr:DUF1028 domain-containing protein [Chloroflexota bacterium]